VQGGVDVLVHTAPNAGPLDEATLAAMKTAGVSVVPTLQLWRHELRHDRTSQREGFLHAGVQQLRAWSALGGSVLFGTDVGYMDDYDPSDEYALMAEAGLSATQILAALTTAPAARFGDGAERGRVAAGLAADLVVLRRDPAQDAKAFADVCATIRGGRVLYQADGCAKIPQHARPSSAAR
jgi:imidazolonepropionase-like amidohydrolase